MRKKIIAANWKMNNTCAQTEVFISSLLTGLNKRGVNGGRNRGHHGGFVNRNGGSAKISGAEIVLCVAFTALFTASRLLKNSSVSLGAQNMNYNDGGAFTGEISADMLKELDVKYVIIGHSERRAEFNETNDAVNKKAIRALQKGLVPVVCAGESAAEREQGGTEAAIKKQVESAVKNIDSDGVKKMVFAYEPLWAIGTGKSASAADANAVIKFIRETLRGQSGKAADAVRILYGGSMNFKNASELLAQSEIDGGLIGSASLKVEEFLKITEGV
jgi:triosephosphate isomerase